jgi:hypothetical protein
VTAEGPVRSSPFAHGGTDLEAGLLEAVGKASLLLEADSLCTLRRTPLVNEDCPEVSDVDIVSIWERPEELPERVTVETSIGRVFVDILWIPASEMLDPVEAAGYKMLPHLLAESETVSTRSRQVGSMVENIKLNMYERAAWERRIGDQLNFGDAALMEASRNMDFPPAVLFFLQTAHAYYMTALADCLRQSVMSLLTRPMTKLRRMSAETGVGLEWALRANLHLEADPSASLEALERVYAAVSARGSPRQAQGLNGRTRGHYLYSISPLELEYREKVAEALVDRGDYANANFYLRFWAYSLSRCPVVIQDARQGRNTSFYVPFRPFKESVQAVCPEIMDDMRMVLGGDVTSEEAEESIRGTDAFRGLVTDQIRGSGLRLISSREAGAPVKGTR